MKKKPARKRIKKAVDQKKWVDPELELVLGFLHGMSASEIAAKSMVGRSTIYNWRAGKVKSPILYTIKSAAEAAGYSLQWKKESKRKNQ